MAQVKGQARRAKAQANSVLSDAKEHRPRGGRRVPRRRRHVRRRDRGFAEAPALRDARDGRRHRLPVRRRLAALSRALGGIECSTGCLRPSGRSTSSLMTDADLRGGRRRGRRVAHRCSSASRSSSGRRSSYGTLAGESGDGGVFPRRCADRDRGRCSMRAARRASAPRSAPRRSGASAKRRRRTRRRSGWTRRSSRSCCRCCCRSRSRRARSACAIAGCCWRRVSSASSAGAAARARYGAKMMPAAEQPAE